MATDVGAAKQVADESSLNHIAASATPHCLTGCAAGEVTGMAIGTASRSRSGRRSLSTVR
jgi:hypothetical protein